MWHIHNLYSLYYSLTIAAITVLTVEMAGHTMRWRDWKCLRNVVWKI
jgi:hypothetical protein